MRELDAQSGPYKWGVRDCLTLAAAPAKARGWCGTPHPKDGPYKRREVEAWFRSLAGALSMAGGQLPAEIAAWEHILRVGSVFSRTPDLIDHLYSRVGIVSTVGPHSTRSWPRLPSFQIAVLSPEGWLVRGRSGLVACNREITMTWWPLPLPYAGARMTAPPGWLDAGIAPAPCAPLESV